MKLNRVRIAALGASAILILAGASTAFAQNPAAQVSTLAPAPAVEEPAGPDTDNVQEGDQSGPDEAGGVESGATEPDTDAVEQGDQTSPDAAEQAAPLKQSAAGVAAAKADTSAAAAPESESAAESEKSAESDGPGGHADPDGQNVDHQFEGEE